MPTPEIYLQQIDEEAQRQGLPPLDPTTLSVLLQIFEQHPDLSQKMASGELKPSWLIEVVKGMQQSRTPQSPGLSSGQPLLQQPGLMPGGMGMPQGMSMPPMGA